MVWFQFHTIELAKALLLFRKTGASGVYPQNSLELLNYGVVHVAKYNDIDSSICIQRTGEQSLINGCQRLRARINVALQLEFAIMPRTS